MGSTKVIRENPPFEFYLENGHVIIYNYDYAEDNCVINLKDILNLELIRSLTFFDKIIEFTFGFWRPSKSDILRINLKNGFKDIILTDCNIEKTESIIYEINRTNQNLQKNQ